MAHNSVVSILKNGTGAFDFQEEKTIYRGICIFFRESRGQISTDKNPHRTYR